MRKSYYQYKLLTDSKIIFNNDLKKIFYDFIKTLFPLFILTIKNATIFYNVA